jgi:hypothetical protein
MAVIPGGEGVVPAPDRLTVIAHDRIRTGTFADMGDAAVQLYDRLVFEASVSGEEVDFSGRLGLDVGGKDGCYRSVIGALGLHRVLTVEPQPAAQVEHNAGFMPTRGGLFQGTIQRWAEVSETPADSVFVFNMALEASRDQTFLRALSHATRMRGLLAVTFREAVTCQTFMNGIRRNPTLGFRHIYDHDADRSGAPPAPKRGISVRDQYLALFRREPTA